MIELSTQAVNILNLYVWDALKNNTTPPMSESDYGGKIPIVPGGQEPDFNNVNKPYLVYGHSEDPGSYSGATRGGTLVYAIYSEFGSDISTIMNIIVSIFDEQDSARKVNVWSSRYQIDTSFPFIGIRFTNVRLLFGEGPGAADQEGGRKVATLTLKYDIVSNYQVKKYDETTGVWH